MNQAQYVTIPIAFHIDREVAAYIHLAYAIGMDKKHLRAMPLAVKRLVSRGKFAKAAAENSPELEKLGYFDVEDAASALDDTCLEGCIVCGKGGQNVLICNGINARGSFKTNEVINGTVAVALPQKKANYFATAYASVEEMADEFKKAVSGICINCFPENMEWWMSKIVNVFGMFESLPIYSAPVIPECAF